MNKTQLVDAIAKKASITKVDAKKALDAFINVTGEALKAGDKIVVENVSTLKDGATIKPLTQQESAERFKAALEERKNQ